MPNDTALAREQLRPYVELAAFREYLKEQIIKWEVWHQSQVDEISMHESCRDRDKVQLENGIRKGIVDPNDPDDIYVLSYEWHKSEVSLIPMDLEFRLVADREPICFQEASIAAIVAMFWCDINGSSMLVPDYDKQPGFCFLEPYGTFQKYLFEQWKKPLQERYKHIDWFVKAAINAYKRRTDDGSVMPSSATEKPTETDDKSPKMTDESPPPKYDPNSADWILSETLCKVLDIKASTIVGYRKPRECGEDTIDEFGSWNVDCVGKFRRKVNGKGSVAYYRPDMSSAYTAKLEYAEAQKRKKP